MDRANSGATLAGEYTPEEVVHLINIRELLDTVPDAHARRERIYRIRPKPNSQLAYDDAATKPTELSHLVTYCQNVAIDNLRSLRLLLYPSKQTGILLPQFGAFPLIRAAIESSAQAVWLQHPEDADERVARALRARRSEVKYEYDLSMMINREDATDPPESKKHKARGRQAASNRAKGWYRDIKTLAQRSGLSESVITEPMPGYGPLIEDAAPTAGLPTNFARSTWQMISGLTHPSSTRGIGFSRVQELDGSTNGLKVTRMTADPKVVEVGLMVGLTFCKTAEDLMSRRLITPSLRR